MYTSVSKSVDGESIMRGEHQVGFVSSIEVKRNIFDSRVQTLFVQTYVLFVGIERQSIDTHTMVTSMIFLSFCFKYRSKSPNMFCRDN